MPKRKSRKKTNFVVPVSWALHLLMGSTVVLFRLLTGKELSSIAVMNRVNSWFDWLRPVLGIIAGNVLMWMLVLPFWVSEATGGRWNPGSLAFKHSVLFGCIIAAVWWWAQREIKAEVLDDVDATRSAKQKLPEEERDSVKAVHITRDGRTEVKLNSDASAERVAQGFAAAGMSAVDPRPKPNQNILELPASSGPPAPLPKLLGLKPDLIGQSETQVWLGAVGAVGDDGAVGDGGTMAWDLSHAPHLLLTGETGSGKGVVIRNCLIHAFLRGYHVYACDPAGSPDFFWARHLMQGYVAGRLRSFEEASRMVALLEKAARTMLRRTDLINNYNDRNPTSPVANWNEFQEISRGLHPEEPSRILVMLDEAAIFSSMCDDPEEPAEAKALVIKASNAISEIVLMGRKVGVHMVLASQRAAMGDLGGGKRGVTIRENCGARILLGHASPATTELALGVRYSDLPKFDLEEGRGLARGLGKGQRGLTVGQFGYGPIEEINTFWPQLSPPDLAAAANPAPDTDQVAA